VAETNIGMWLDRSLRTGGCGTWWSAATASGQPLGLLQLEPKLMAQPAVQDRVAAAVAAVRAANPRGALRTTELVVDTRRAWLVVAALPTPTLDDLLTARPALAPGAAAGIALDIAQSLRDLHAVGISHGDLAADIVVLTRGGAATLVEVGVLAALRDRPTDIGRDVLAWSALARDLATMTSSLDEAGLLSAAATIAESGDLATAARRLADRAADLPDFAGRESVIAMLPSLAPAPARIPAQRSPTTALDGPEPSAVDVNGAGLVRIRFGRGIPEAAIAAADRAADQRQASRPAASRAAASRPAASRPAASRAAASRPAASRRRRSLRALRIAVLALSLLLGVGAGVLAIIVLRG
jgi:tRNA A-37 threonylcarbamoyl transferase component Bud32